MVDIAKLAIEVDSSQALSASKNLDAMSQSSGRAEKATKASGTAAQNSSYKYRMAAMQLSQVASQGSVTGNYLQALAIQLPDLALGFGTLGIVIGSVAGALAVPLFNAIGAAEKSVSDLSDDVDTLSMSLEKADSGTYQLSESMRDLEQVSRSAARLKISIDTAAAFSALDELNENIAESVGDVFEPAVFGIASLEKILRGSTLAAGYFEQYRFGADLAEGEISELIMAFREANEAATPESYEKLSKTVISLKEKYGDTNSGVNELAESMAEQIPAAIRAAQLYERLKGVLNGTADSAGVATVYYDELSTAIDKNAFSLSDWIRENERAQADYQALLAKMVTSTFDAEQQAAQALGMRAQRLQEWRDNDLISDEQYKQGLIEAEQEYTDRVTKIKQKQRDVELGMNKETLSTTADFFGTLAQIAQAGGEDQFNTWKRLAQAQAAISASLAVLQVLGDQTVPAPLKPFAAGAMAALAAVQIGQIENTQYSARALGGQVKAGESYIVGENGPERLTMGSDGHITSNANMQSSGGDNYVFQISTGVSQTVRAELVSLMPMITKTALQATRGRR